MRAKRPRHCERSEAIPDNETDCFIVPPRNDRRRDRRQFWEFPWRYKEAVAFVGGIIAIGFMLQLSVGAFNFAMLQFPVNCILGGLIVLFLFLFSLKRKNPFYQWFSGISMAVPLISALVILGIIMGLTPQVDSAVIAKMRYEDKAIFSRLGFTHMTSSWPFVLVYFLTLLSLGALIIRRMIPFQIKDYVFYLNHIGLWLLLFAAGMGSADIKRYVMHVREGETEWRVYNDKDEEALDLPIAIELNDFYMDEYPPKLTVISRKTGASQPENKPDYFQIDGKQSEGNVAGWNISLKQYIHQAVRNSDSAYREVRMPGASPAAKVAIRHPKTGIQKEGWVCAGNMAQLYMILNLDEHYCLAMTRPEPKRFVSDINIYSEDGKQAHTLLEVNKPYKLGHWMIYQYGYDNDAGNMSTYSSFELVYDPWIMAVYIGIILLAGGSVCMLWAGNKRKEANNDVE